MRRYARLCSQVAVVKQTSILILRRAASLLRSSRLRWFILNHVHQFVSRYASDFDRRVIHVRPLVVSAARTEWVRRLNSLVQSHITCAFLDVTICKRCCAWSERRHVASSLGGEQELRSWKDWLVKSGLIYRSVQSNSIVFGYTYWMCFCI